MDRHNREKGPRPAPPSPSCLSACALALGSLSLWLLHQRAGTPTSALRPAISAAAFALLPAPALATLADIVRAAPTEAACELAAITVRVRPVRCPRSYAPRGDISPHPPPSVPASHTSVPLSRLPPFAHPPVCLLALCMRCVCAVRRISLLCFVVAAPSPCTPSLSHPSLPRVQQCPLARSPTRALTYPFHTR